MDSIKPDPKNPNRLDAATRAGLAAALAEFGDLSGIVINRRTGSLVGGHQRADILAGARLDVSDLAKPEPDGTVARGHIESNGRRYAVRVVDWPEDRAHAALLAANRYGRRGQDDAALLQGLLAELDKGQTTDAGALLADLTGFDKAERDALTALPEAPDLSSGGATEETIRLAVYVPASAKAEVTKLAADKGGSALECTTCHCETGLRRLDTNAWAARRDKLAPSSDAGGAAR